LKFAEVVVSWAAVREFLAKNIYSNDFSTWVLLALFLTLLFYAAERGLFLHSGKVNPRQFMNGVISLLSSGRYNEALTVCEDSPGVVPLIVKTALAMRGKSRAELSHAISNVALLEVPLLERRLNSVRLIAKVAPAVSFIGVLRILSRTLGGIGHSEVYFSAALMLEFMQQAVTLIAIGLTINVLGALAYSFLHGRVLRLMHDMEWSCNEILGHMDVANWDSDANRKI
jgi:biopolymer transport protein ExbB